MSLSPAPARRRWRAPVVIGLLVALGALAAFVALTLAVVGADPALATWDDRIGAALTQLRATPAGSVLAGLSALHAPRGIVALTALASLLLWLRHRRADVAVLLVSVFGGATINHLLKHGIQRPRPGLEQAVGIATDFGFPSGHVANATLLYGTLAALIVWRARERPLRIGSVAIAALLVAAIGCSRVVLGAHRASDVVAGVLVGLAWAALCLAVFAAIRTKPDCA